MEDRAAKASALGVIIIHTAGPATAHALQDVCGCMSYGRGLTGAVYPVDEAMREPEWWGKQGGFPRFFMPATDTIMDEDTPATGGRRARLKQCNDYTSAASSAPNSKKKDRPSHGSHGKCRAAAPTSTRSSTVRPSTPTCSHGCLTSWASTSSPHCLTASTVASDHCRASVVPYWLICKLVGRYIPQ